MIVNTMSTQSNYNKRIAKNTLLLYFRMLFIMVVSLKHRYKSSQFHSGMSLTIQLSINSKND